MTSLLDEVVHLTMGNPEDIAEGNRPRIPGIKIRQKPGFENLALYEAIETDSDIPRKFAKVFPDILAQKRNAATRAWSLWDVVIKLDELSLHYVDWHNALFAPVKVPCPTDIGLIFIEPILEPGQEPAVCDYAVNDGELRLKLAQGEMEKSLSIAY